MDDFQKTNLAYEKIHSMALVYSPIIYPFTLPQIAAAQRQDRVLSEVVQWLTDDIVDFSQLYDEELTDMKDRFDMISIVNDVWF